MKILHTSDWHIGHRLHEHTQFEEQTLFFNWLVKSIDTQKIDVLLVSGDVFDSSSPSAQSQKMYYDVLIKISRTYCSHIVITGGNHDSPGMLNAPKQILGALNIIVVAKATENIEDEVFEFNINGEHLIIGAVPYLRDQDIRRAVAGENFDDITQKYKLALKKHYSALADYCKNIKKENSFVLAMGHLFAVEGKVSESEKDIYVGNLGHISADDFSTVFNYVALGHLHRAQLVGDKNHIRYCGSPLIYSFSEVLNDKIIFSIAVNKGEITEIEEISIPKFRLIKKYKGDFNHHINKFKTFKNNEYNLTPWVEVVLVEDTNLGLQNTEINRVATENGIDVLKISIENDQRYDVSDEFLETAKSIKELKPIAVFEMKCKEKNINLEERTDILDAFSEVLDIAKNM